MTEQVTELITVIKESELQTRRELSELSKAQAETNKSIQKMADNFSQYYQHVAVWEEERKHDAEFKKEVREHITKSNPLLSYVEELKATTSKMRIAFFIAIMFAVLTGLGLSLK